MNWRRHALPLLATLLVAHAASLWLYPRAVMRALARQITPAEARDRIVLPPPADHDARRVVMPSPDLLYALCPYDLDAGPWRASAAPQGVGYWSIALYGANSDNWYVVNDRGAAGAPVALTLRRPGDGAAAKAGELIAPQARGLLLMRVLIDGSAESLAAAEVARRTLRCGPVG